MRAIDLAQLECDLARPADARSVLAQITAGVSSYGAMEIESVRLDIAVQEGNLAQANRSLHYLRAHRGDAAITYVTALVTADQLDRAAREIRRQLAGALTRQDALAVVQTYLPQRATPRDLELRARWQSVLAREDVQAAIDRVGRVASYGIEGALF